MVHEMHRSMCMVSTQLTTMENYQMVSHTIPYHTILHAMAASLRKAKTSSPTQNHLKAFLDHGPHTMHLVVASVLNSTQFKAP
jgi:hypothetical protein